MDERAQSIGIARLFLSLGVGAIIIWIVGSLTAPLFEYAGEQTQSGTVYAEATNWLQQGVDFLPLAFLLISLFGLIAYSVFRRGVLR